MDFFERPGGGGLLYGPTAIFVEQRGAFLCIGEGMIIDFTLSDGSTLKMRRINRRLSRQQIVDAVGDHARQYRVGGSG